MKAHTTLAGLIALTLFGIPRPGAGQDLLLENAQVVDVESGAVTRSRTVVIRDGRIERIAPGSVEAPSGAERLDLGGRYVAPGLMDAHVHIASEDQARRALQSGVTTARSAGVGHYVDVGLSALIAEGHADGPELLATGYHVRPGQFEAYWLDNPEMARFEDGGLETVEGLRALTGTNLERGVRWIKAASTERAGLPHTDPRKQVLDRAQMTAIVETAAERGVPVMTHAHGDAGARAAVSAGVRSIEHGTYMSRETLRMMVERGTYYVPTIAIVNDLVEPGGDYSDAHLQIRGRHMLPRLRETARMAHEMGIPLVASTDTGYGPESVTRVSHELIEFVERVGMSPSEALRAATVVAAELFGIEDRTGRVAEGMEADLIVLERNPLEEIDTVQDVLLVVSDGRVAARKGDW